MSNISRAKRKEWNEFKIKNDLENYRIFKTKNKRVLYFFYKDNSLISSVSGYSEIKRIRTFKKNIKKAKVIYLWQKGSNEYNWVDFESPDELREFLLVSKLSGI